MRKIMVVGVSAGVGKSTFAAKLGEILDLPVHHLDSYHWKPGWQEAEKEEFESVQYNIVKRDRWIIEGNYSSTFDIRMAQADTFIYLELPLRVCLYRVLKRWLSNIGKTRPDMGEGCPEKMEWEFLKFIVTTYAARKVKMRSRMRSFLEARDGNKVILLSGKKEIAGFLETVDKERIA
ncbi:topology modulation protein [Planococcus sp. APC 3906]|uniref:topology modulation protein n=1 Tax=Planococcus TaxID=1372 RepID=UPI0025B5D638|nr:topology modulation protein [Planococcus sp. APC 3906]MDN3449016.1 topology modulation protein [Planococcus sp. APC 3906]